MYNIKLATTRTSGNEPYLQYLLRATIFGMSKTGSSSPILEGPFLGALRTGWAIKGSIRNLKISLSASMATIWRPALRQA
jgi:hypothetical protein